MVKKIVTHVPPRHLDDTLATALLTQKYPDAEVEFVHPQDEEKLSLYREDSKVILVDVGGSYDPDRKNYDHHQDLELPCSLVLVLKNEFPELYEAVRKDSVLSRELEYIDVKDRKGFKAASEELKMSFPVLLESLVNEAGRDVQGIKTVGKALYGYLEKKRELYQKLDNVKVEEIGGLKVAFDPYPLPAGEVFRHTQAVLLIQRNSMNPNQTSVIKNTSDPVGKLLCLESLKEEFPVTFLHKAGFLAVIDESFEEVGKDVGRIVDAVAEGFIRKITGEKQQRQNINSYDLGR